MELDELEYYIGKRLESLTTFNVYNTNAPSDATPPYLLYTIDSCNYRERARKDWLLNLEFWDYKLDNSDLIDESKNVKNGVDPIVGLDRSTQVEVEGFYTCIIDFESIVPVPEHGITRYDQRYVVKVD